MKRLFFFVLLASLALSLSSTLTSGKVASTNSEPSKVSAPAIPVSIPTPATSVTSTTNTALPVAAKPVPADEDSADDDSPGVLKIQVGDHHHDGTFIASIVPIVAIIATFGTPVLIVFCIAYFRFRRRQETLSTVREYVSKGLPVPPEILTGGDFRRGETTADLLAGGAGRCDVRRGIKLVFIGAAISLAIFVSNPRHHDWAWGLIPLVIGLGYLAVGYFEMNEDKKNGRPPGSPL